MSYKSFPPAEVAARGEQLYRDHIQPQMQAADLDKFVVIDVASGDFEIADDDLAATKRLLSRRPDAFLYGVRVGHSAAYALGGHFVAAEL
jgi:hypothetical protein